MKDLQLIKVEIIEWSGSMKDHIWNIKGLSFSIFSSTALGKRLPAQPLKRTLCEFLWLVQYPYHISYAIYKITFDKVWDTYINRYHIKYLYKYLYDIYIDILGTKNVIILGTRLFLCSFFFIIYVCYGDFFFLFFLFSFLSIHGA